MMFFHRRSHGALLYRSFDNEDDFRRFEHSIYHFILKQFFVMYFELFLSTCVPTFRNVIVIRNI